MFNNVASGLNRSRVLFAFLLIMLVTATTAIPAAQADERICFPEAAPVIRDCIEGRFAQFWRANGGLAVFGYPITEARAEVNKDTGNTYITQYFERQRFELHPENQAPYDVLLGRLGAEWLDRALADGFNAGDKGSADLPHYVSETGFNIGFKPNKINIEGGWYYDYYSTHGLEFDGKSGTSHAESLALIGYPISATRLRMTDETSFQVFERTILRYQGPAYKNDPAWRIVGDRIGVWYYKFVLNADSENRLSYP